VLVALNMSGSAQKATFAAGSQASLASLKSLLATSGAESKGAEVTLPPFGVFIAEVEQK